MQLQTILVQTHLLPGKVQRTAAAVQLGFAALRVCMHTGDAWETLYAGAVLPCTTLSTHVRVSTRVWVELNDVVGHGGPTFQAGDQLKMHYTGTIAETSEKGEKGKKFDSSLDGGRDPFDFQLGQGQVIKGWDQGIVIACGLVVLQLRSVA